MSAICSWSVGRIKMPHPPRPIDHDLNGPGTVGRRPIHQYLVVAEAVAAENDRTFPAPSVNDLPLAGVMKTAVGLGTAKNGVACWLCSQIR
jgi:hypothetical protein